MNYPAVCLAKQQVCMQDLFLVRLEMSNHNFPSINVSQSHSIQIRFQKIWTSLFKSENEIMNSIKKNTE